MTEKTPPMRIRVWQNEPNGEFVASFPGDLCLDENTEYVRADIHDKLVEALEILIAWKHAVDTVAPELGGLLVAIYNAEAVLASLQTQDQDE